MSTEAPESLGILDGVCTNGNVHFWIYFIGSIAMTLLILYCRHRLVTPPKFHPSRSKADVGLPFDIAILVYNICLWSVAPQVALFLMYHVITTDVFSKQTYLACITLSGVPVIVVVLFTQATAILLRYRSDWIRVDVASEVVPSEYGVATGNRPVKILFLGCTGHGMLLVDCLENAMNGSWRNWRIASTAPSGWAPTNTIYRSTTVYLTKSFYLPMSAMLRPLGK
jgi:hypothetical protein